MTASKLSPDADRILKDIYPTTATPEQIAAALTKVGHELSWQQIKRLASRRGLKRPYAPPPTPPRTEPAQASLDADDILIRFYPDGVATADIADLIREKTGVTFSDNAIRKRVTRLKLRRPPGWQPTKPKRVQAPEAPPRRTSEPVHFETVAAWAAAHGVRFREWDDLPRVNERVEAMGQERFRRELPCHRIGRFRRVG